MNFLKPFMCASIAAAGVYIAGCDRSAPPPPPPPPPPPQAQAEPPPQEAGQPIPEDQPEQDIVVPEAPPPPVVETVPVAPPEPDYVWVGGYWDWNNTQYVWVPGRYRRPPGPDRVWVPPRTYHDAHGNHYVPGGWRPHH